MKIKDRDELLKITEEINRLKKYRVKKFGKDWNNKIVSKNGFRWCAKDRLSYLRKIDEYIALNGIPISRACQNIGIYSSVYYRLKNSSINTSNQDIIILFFKN